MPSSARRTTSRQWFHWQTKPRGPARAAESFRIRNREGLFLWDTVSTPYRWTGREAMAMAFDSKEEARQYITKHFAGPSAARELLGLRVV